MLPEFLWKGEQLARVSGSTCPVNQSLVLIELRNTPQPECSTLVGNCDHIRKITRAQAAADCQLHTFQQPSGVPLFLEPAHGDRRSAVGGVPAAASLANGHMSDDETLGGQREGIVAI